MRCESSAQPLCLTIVGVGIEAEKMRKRLQCAARATNTEMHLAWRDGYADELDVGASNPVAVCHHNKVIVDGLVPTEEIESILVELKKEGRYGT